MEHCFKNGHSFEFETSNYKIKTTSKKEYQIVVGEVTADPADMLHGRRIPNLEELQALEMSICAGLQKIEIILLVLYTGPMVHHRQFSLFVRFLSFLHVGFPFLCQSCCCCALGLIKYLASA